MFSPRHEQAAVTVAAYTIGAVTAFIWYGLTPGHSVPALETPNLDLTASVISALPAQTAPVVPELAEAVPSVVTYEDGVLRVNAFGGSKILSFNPTVSGIAKSDDFLMQGYHEGSLIYSVSATGEYVFFCEAKTVDAPTCSPFIYDVLNDNIQPLKKSGARVDVIVSAAKNAHFENTMLILDDQQSASDTNPWILR